MTTAYPLAWPDGWPRTPSAKQAPPRFRSGAGPFRTTVSKLVTVPDARKRLADELDALGARLPVLSTNLELRADGQPRGGLAEPTDRGAACYFHLAEKPMVLACDRWNSVAGNIAAIAAHIGAMRGMERWGVGSAAQLFAGFAALPSAGPGQRPWRDVLGRFLPAGAVTSEHIDVAYRKLAIQYHPDRGGTHDQMAALNVARDEALAEIRA